MKRFFLICSMIFVIFAPTEAALIEKGASIAVTDLGVHQGTSEPDMNLLNAERSSSEYIIQRLVMTNNFEVKDRNLVLETMQKLNTTGLIDSDTAKKIGDILGVKYIVYGNVTDVSLDDEMAGNILFLGGSRTVKAHLVIRIMNVETGKILTAAKGEGKSTSANVGAVFIFIGTTKVSQTAVHNALQKAAFQAVDVLNERLFTKSK